LQIKGLALTKFSELGGVWRRWHLQSGFALQRL